MALHWTQEEQDREELANLERLLRDVEDPGRQVAPSAAGQEYRKKLRQDIARLRDRLSVKKAS